MTTQAIPLAAGATTQVTGHSIDSFYATAGGSLTITGNDGVARNYPIQVGPNAIAVPISADPVDQGTARVVSAGAAGTINVVDGPGPALSASPTLMTVAQLPAAASTPVGVRATVSDATVVYTSANVGSTVAGGGANATPVFNNGTNWVIG